MDGVANRRNTGLSLFLAAAIVVLAAPVFAQGAGVRGGLSVDPDQVFVGAHYETSALVDRVHFKPNIEIGFGEDVTLIALNFEGVYKLPRRNQWGVYAGGGPALNVLRFGGDSDSGAGFNFLAGVENTRGLAFEIKFGVADSPTVKIGVGWTFK